MRPIQIIFASAAAVNISDSHSHVAGDEVASRMMSDLAAYPRGTPGSYTGGLGFEAFYERLKGEIIYRARGRV